jgi:cytochrome bd ubiquinol oxidase subunit II
METLTLWLANPLVVEGLPLIFAVLMGIAILTYVVLDGYDLGVGILFPLAKDKEEKDILMGSIGPFWDANETWLVLAVGLLLVAFPLAHGVILTALYLPVFLMLIGLIFRGVAFEFRAKAKEPHQAYWNWAFFGGSLLTALAQGYMLGIYILGLQHGIVADLFAFVIGLCLAAAYALIGAGWLIMKTEGALQKKALAWAKEALSYTALGMVAVSLMSPLASTRIWEKWFSWPEVLFLAPLPILSAAIFARLWWMLRQPKVLQERAWYPFFSVVALKLLGFMGLAYSFFPYVVPEKLTIWQAASATGSLALMLVGALLVLPVMFGYTFLVYKIFHGKATGLSYH